jgi:hypothetical protein
MYHKPCRFWAEPSAVHFAGERLLPLHQPPGPLRLPMCRMHFVPLSSQRSLPIEGINAQNGEQEMIIHDKMETGESPVKGPDAGK